ncbi:hypothetical protein EYR38_003305 [Pleurotus pulmonarius]|nr:hypothetical protein EYR38_003305 [Pleurotus pulmonarius]
MPRTRSSGRRTARSQNPYSQVDRPGKGNAHGKGRKYGSENERPDPSSFANGAGHRKPSDPKRSRADPVIGTTGKRTTGPSPQGRPKFARNQQGAAPLGSSSTENFHPLLAEKRAAEVPIKLPESSPKGKVRGNGEKSYNPPRGALVKSFTTDGHAAGTKRKKQPVKTKTKKQLAEPDRTKIAVYARCRNPKVPPPSNPPKDTNIKLNTR